MTIMDILGIKVADPKQDATAFQPVVIEFAKTIIAEGAKILVPAIQGALDSTATDVIVNGSQQARDVVLPALAKELTEQIIPALQTVLDSTRVTGVLSFEAGKAIFTLDFGRKPQGPTPKP